MTVAICNRCSKFISISQIPGGNPVAVADPDRWAATYGREIAAHGSVQTLIRRAGSAGGADGARSRFPLSHSTCVETLGAS